MSEFTITPGPWINDDGLVNGRHSECDDMPSYDIFNADEWPGNYKEALGNARLIAAAPDLLAACQRAYECCYDKNSEDGIALKAAIDKATGPTT